MTCEKAEGLLSAYLDDMLTPQLSQEVAAHVEGCASCREILADYRRSDASIATSLQTAQVEPPASLRDRIFSSAEYAAILKHAAEVEASQETERVRSVEDTPRRAAAPPGWARGALAAAVALIVFGSALLIKQGLLYSGTPSAHSTTILNGNPGTQPLAAGTRVIYEQGGVLWSVLASGSDQADHLTPSGVHVGAWSVSPDGRSVAYVDEATGRIHVMRSDDQNDLATSSVSSTGPGAKLVWSPDGLRIAYIAAQSAGSPALRIVNADGSNDIAVEGSTAVAGAPVWSSDAAFLAYVQGDNSGETIWVYNAATKLTRDVSAADPAGAHGQVTASGPRWLADTGKPRVTWATTDGTRITGIYVASALSGAAVRESAAGATLGAADVSWAPDGASAAFVTSDGRLDLWSPAAGASVVSSVANVSGTPVWSANSHRLAVASGSNVIVVDVASGSANVVAADGTPVSFMFAPDGAGLAVATASGVTMYVDVAAPAKTVPGSAEYGTLAWSIAG